MLNVRETRDAKRSRNTRYSTFAKHFSAPANPDRSSPTLRHVNAPQILVVDDEPMVREVVARYLQRDGMTVIEAADGSEALAALASHRIDLVVLDVMLPNIDGLSVLRHIRDQGTIPVILLTARAEEVDRIVGLELGADDYVVKPFSPRELAVRVRNVHRRSLGTVAASLSGAGSTLMFDDLSIDSVTREVTARGALVALTPKEFDLLTLLASAPRRVFTRGQLLEEVWDSSPDYQDQATVTVHVGRLRQKLELEPDQPRWITTVRGVGYRFEP